MRYIRKSPRQSTPIPITRTAAAKVDGDQPLEFQEPAPYRFVRYIDATFSQQILDITKGQRESGVKPDCVLDNLRRKTMSLERN